MWRQLLIQLLVPLAVPPTVLGLWLMANGFFGFIAAMRGSASNHGVVLSISQGLVLLAVGVVIEILAWGGIIVIRRKARRPSQFAKTP